MIDLNYISTEIPKLHQDVSRLIGQRDLLEEDLEKFSHTLVSTDHDLEIFDKAKMFLQKVSETARTIAKNQIEIIVTSALQYVFGEHYSFKVELRHTAVGPLADFVVLTTYGDRTIENLPITGKGGGVIDILAVALKFALLELLQCDGPLWLDEPFKHVSTEYIQTAGKLLTFIGETSTRQIIIITHNPQLAELCNNTLKVTQANGASHVAV